MVDEALSRLKEADEELFSNALSPVVRAKLMATRSWLLALRSAKDFEVPRDLCTLAFAYSNARVIDEGLFSAWLLLPHSVVVAEDLAHILSSKVRLMWLGMGSPCRL